MANINGNNVDDLFRQASDQYPLRTDSADWDKLAGALDADPSLISHQGNEQDGRRRKRFLWLILPLLAGGLGYFAWKGNSHGQKSEINQQGKTYAKAVLSTTGEEGSGETSAKNLVPMGAKDPGAMSPKDPATTSADYGDLTSAKRTSLQAKEGTAVRTGAKARTGMNLGTVAAKTGIGGTEDAEERTGLNRKALLQGRNEKDAGRVRSGAWVKPGTSVKLGTTIALNDARYSKVNGPGSMKARDITINAEVRSPAPASLKKTPTRIKSRHSIYVGLLGAPDLSTIEFQSVKSVGTTFGILGGYAFNSKWSLETGVYLDKKKYFTEGQYFSKKNVPALQSYNLQTVDGACNMIEIPLNLRYNVFAGKRRELFATAGLSTYLMSKEQYTYQTLRYGAPMNSPIFTYTNPYHYLFSIVDLSLGYEQKLGKIGSLRIEPYVRMPLSGIGTGNLTIMSAGLNLGLIRRI